ncbi:hypothetical protein [Sphingobium yanoikuyae]|uniref:hypothetical protein n=1 Tax=Sphingobium yanoikuyae TaxID=13690 RepID=UPI0026EFC0E4|nr:hypothetical protein [Sphingobium yanoikuyae]
MSLGIAKFTQFQKAQRDTAEAKEWLAHIGARGRGNDTLQLSHAHCSMKLTIAGQYTEGGKNYWESPACLNSALLSVIIRKRDELLAEAVELLKSRETSALIDAKSEIDAINAAIEAAAA